MKTIDEENKLLEKIIFKKYILKSQLGKGTFSKIFLGQNITNNKSYAFKCVDYSLQDLLALINFIKK